MTSNTDYELGGPETTVPIQLRDRAGLSATKTVTPLQQNGNTRYIEECGAGSLNAKLSRSVHYGEFCSFL
jgi:hypothetical protein